MMLYIRVPIKECLMSRFSILSFLTLCSIVLSNGCKTGTESSASDCGDAKEVSMHSAIYDSTGTYRYLETPEARNDCEARYQFYFRWANTLTQALRTDMPPLGNLDHMFAPGGEFAYFPHPAPVYDAGATFSEGGVQYGGKGWWVIDFAIGNKNSGNPSTRYGVGANVDFSKADESDSIEIGARIGYFDKGIK